VNDVTKTQVGDSEVFILNDGNTTFETETFTSTSANEIKSLLEKAGQSSIKTSFNAFLIRSGNEITLVDSGAGELFGSIAGNLNNALNKIGVSRSDITKVIATHMHPDHIGGMIDSNGNRYFDNAELILSIKEHSFWSNTKNFIDHPEQQVHALKVLHAYSDRLILCKSNADLGRDLSSIDLPGHTAGHIGVRVSSNSSQFIIAGDIVHAQYLQFINPNIGVTFDQDYDMAKNSRLKMLNILSSEEIPFSGGHLLSPGVVTVRRDRTKYILNVGTH